MPGSLTDPIPLLASLAGTTAINDGRLLAVYDSSFNVYSFTITSLTISGPASAGPEPSTYALVFGTIVAGFAFWRRRETMRAAS